MGTTTETRITSTQAKDAIYKAHSMPSVDMVNEGLFSRGNMITKEPAMTGHILKTAKPPNTAYREHNEPSGWIDSGTASKTDWMLDPYDISPTQYRIGNVFTKTNTDGAAYTNGAFCVGAKASGSNNFGQYPVMQLGFQDCSDSGTPLSLYYFDTSDTIWRIGQQGMWREGKSVEAGKYVIYGGKLYKTIETGICGATPPTHTAGIASDGTINLEYIRTFNSTTIRPTVVVGDRDDLPKFGWLDVRLQLLKDTIVGYARKLHFLDQNGVSTSIQAGTDKSISILDQNSVTVFIADMTNQRFDFRKKILIREGIQDYTGSTGTAGQVLVADGTGKCKWVTI